MKNNLQDYHNLRELSLFFRFFSTTGSEMSPESGRTGKPRIALTGDSDVLIRVLNEQYIFINYVISSIILVYLCELFQSKWLVWTVSLLPELNIENLWYYRDDRHPHTGVIFRC